MKKIIIEGSDGVGKTVTINELKKYNIICQDRSIDIISKYMMFDVTMEKRVKAYSAYLENTNDIVIILINNNEEELKKRIGSRKTIDIFDLDTFKYNKMYLDTYNYMKEHNMLYNKLFIVDTTNLTIDEQVKEVKDIILCLV